MRRQSRSNPIVETTNGKLCGNMDGDVRVFKGMRYADTTAGENRFLPPRPVRKWPGIRDATQWGASAPQLSSPANKDPFYSWYSAIERISEDCLSINVFTPATDGARRPVMFWIHGGGWREFSGTAPGFHGANLARAQDVVVVTVNHRLNAFGYLRFEDADERFADAANAGLLDLIMALTWVRDNVAAFGGDPANVTLFGQSGGGSKIAALLAMPAAMGLFHKAIIQSSASGLRLATQNEAARHAADLAKALGRSRLTGEALQSLPMEDLLSAVKAVSSPFRAMIDDRHFSDHPYNAAAPVTASRIPLMVECTNTETTYYLRADPKNFTLERASVKQRLTRFLRIEEHLAETIIEAYRSAYPDYSPSDVLIMITSDYVFKRNTLKIASLQATSAIAPVYAYLFNRDTRVEDGRLRSPHTGEVPFIFGTTAVAEALVGTGPDVAPMTDQMMAIWGAFARTGNPNNALIPDWRPFTAADRHTMILNAVSRSDRDPGGQARAALDQLPYFGSGHSLQAFVRE
jgi:para-nitrobenzyl esterase